MDRGHLDLAFTEYPQGIEPAPDTALAGKL